MLHSSIPPSGRRNSDGFTAGHRIPCRAPRSWPRTANPLDEPQAADHRGGRGQLNRTSWNAHVSGDEVAAAFQVVVHVLWAQDLLHHHDLGRFPSRLRRPPQRAGGRRRADTRVRCPCVPLDWAPRRGESSARSGTLRCGAVGAACCCGWGRNRGARPLRWSLALACGGETGAGLGPGCGRGGLAPAVGGHDGEPAAGRSASPAGRGGSRCAAAPRRRPPRKRPAGPDVSRAGRVSRAGGVPARAGAP